LPLPDGQVHHDTHVVPMRNYVIAAGNYVIVTCLPVGNYVSADMLRGSAEFRPSFADAPPHRRDLLERLTSWADMPEQEGLVTLSTYRGKGGIVTLLPRLAIDNGLVTIYNDIKSAYMQFWRSAFERRAPMALPAVEAALGTALRQCDAAREISDDLLDALTSAYREAVTVTTAST
jgi:hypothetical protein